MVAKFQPRPGSHAPEPTPSPPDPPAHHGHDDGPLAAYRRRRAQDGLRPDPAQERCAQRLQRLHDELRGYRPAPRLRRRRLGLRHRIGLGPSEDRSAAPRGLYIHGPVGRGKSMLMDLFFAGAPVDAKRRVHFHEFMLGVHARLHRRRQAGPSTDDALKEVAAALAAEAWLLCFDEFHVDNIVDAMLLGRLFGALFERGMVVVATSNWPPERLYERGLQRALFLPFIDLLKERCEVVALAGPTDYRLERLRDMRAYHSPLGPETDAALDDAFAALADGDEEPGPEEIEVGAGRRLRVPTAANGVARFTFAELCERPLGAADYLALAGRYHTLILNGVPVLRPHQRNEAKRLIALVDTLYDKRVRLIVGAEAEPTALHPEGEHAFEFQRTVSRLMEMQSREYIEEER